MNSSGMVHSLTKHLRRDQKYERLPTEDAEIQNVKDARVYVFGENDVAEEELNSDEAISLRDRSKKKKPLPKEETEDLLVDREISEGDTLRSLALKYGCPVSELKRVNNLIRDQDFYALKYIKIPMKRHGLLLEMVEKEGMNKDALVRGADNMLGSEPIDVSDYDMEARDDEEEEIFVRKVGIRGPVGRSNPATHMRFLDQMDKDINNIVTSTRTRLDSLEKVVEKITCKTIHPLKRRSSWSSRWSGADCGIQWATLILVIFFIGLVAPLSYFLYYEYSSRTQDGGGDSTGVTQSTGNL